MPPPPVPTLTPENIEILAQQLGQQFMAPAIPLSQGQTADAALGAAAQIPVQGAPSPFAVAAQAADGQQTGEQQRAQQAETTRALMQGVFGPTPLLPPRAEPTLNPPRGGAFPTVGNAGIAQNQLLNIFPGPVGVNPTLGQIMGQLRR